jgi:hypothetical protein
MSVCYHRGVREQWYLYRKYLKLTPRAFLCASKEKGHAVSDEALLSVDRTVFITFISKEKAPTLAKPGRHLGSSHNPEKWITTRAVLVQVIVGARVLKKWPCGREYHLIRMYWSLPHPLGCVLRRAVPCPSAGLKDRSLSGAILIILLILSQLVV